MGRHKSVVIINIAVFLLMLGMGMIVSLLPQQIINLSGSASSVGYLASAFALPYVLLQIPVGNLADRYGFKPFLAGGYLLCSLAGVIYYLSESSTLIFLGRMVQGGGEIPVWAVAPALLSIQYPDKKGKVMGIYSASLHCGLTTGSLLGVLTSKMWQHGEAFLFFAVLSLVGALLILFSGDTEQQQSLESLPTISSGYIISLFNSSINKIIIAGVLLYGAGYGIFITVIPAFMISVRGCSQISVGIFFMLFYIALSLSQLITGPVSDCKGRKPVMVSGLIMAAVGILTFQYFDLPWFIGLLTLSATGLGGFSIAAMAFLNESVTGSFKGTISGAFYFAWGAGYFFAPMLLGKLGEHSHFEIGFLLIGVLLLLDAAALYVAVNRRVKAVELSSS